MTAKRGYRCFGISLASPLMFPGAWPTRQPEPDATLVVPGEFGSWADDDQLGWQGRSDGEVFAVRRSAAGVHRFSHGGQAIAELSADHRRLTIPARTPDEVRLWRALLDSVLFTVSLLRGHEALHAGAVATAAGVVAIVGDSGAGKSTLVAQLVANGHPLLTDDVLVLSATNDGVLAHSGPPLMTLPRPIAPLLGDPIGEVGDEVWTAVPVQPDPDLLRRIVVLDRTADEPPRLTEETDHVPLLLRHLMGFPRRSERELARLDLASRLSAQAEVVRLHAAPTTPPQRLAEIVLGGLVTR